MKEDVTLVSPLPDKVKTILNCWLLHHKVPTWDGDYKYDENMKKNVPNIRILCKECSGHVK